MPQENKAEAFFAKYKVPISIGVNLVSKLVGAVGLPGAPILAEVMAVAIELAGQASDNIEECKEVVTIIWSCDESLSQVPDRQERLRHCVKELQGLEGVLKDVCEFVQAFGRSNTAVRVAFSGKDAERLAALRRSLNEAMLVRRC